MKKLNGKIFILISAIIISTINIENTTLTKIALASPAFTIPYVPSNLSKVFIDGRIEENEYGGSYTDSYPALPAIYWEHDGVNMRVGLVSPGTGWVSIGFGKRGMGMHGSNIIIGYVDDKGVHIEDNFGIGVNHTSDLSLGGKDNVIVAAGSEIDGKTIIEFIFPLNSGDAYDHAFEVGGTYSFIIAFSKFAKDFTTFHGATRSGILDLYVGENIIKLQTILDLYLPEKVIKNESVKIMAILKDKNGIFIEGEIIDFYMRTTFGWLKLGSNKTDQNGVATLKFIPPDVDIIDVMVTYVGSLKFGASENSSSLRVEYPPTPKPPFSLLFIPPPLTIAQIIIGTIITGVAGTLGYVLYMIHRIEHVSLPTVPLFRISIYGLLILQTVLMIIAWTLNPIPIKNQQIFSFNLAAEFVILSMLIYLYRVSHGLSNEDLEWLALGVAAVVGLLLFAFFL